MAGQRRVAVISDASFYVGPDLARNLARRGHDLVLGDPSEALVEELQQLGAEVAAVPGVARPRRPRVVGGASPPPRSIASAGSTPQPRHPGASSSAGS